MPTQLRRIKEHSIILLIIGLNCISSICLSQNTSKLPIIFKIVNYKEYRKANDSIFLSVENTSNKPLFFTIREEELDNGHWSIDILDLLAADPLKANIIIYKIIKPHKLKPIKISPEKLHYPLITKKSGFSSPKRYVLNYSDAGKVAKYNENTVISREFKIRY